jgi:galactose mutarotase-like enzyme
MTPPWRPGVTLRHVQSLGATTVTIGEPTVGTEAPLTLTSAGSVLQAGFVPTAGMVGCSLRHRGVELLGSRAGRRTEVAQRAAIGMMLLYPWANRLRRRRFPVAGRMVVLDRPAAPVSFDERGLPIHGLLAGAAGWTVRHHAASGDGAALEASFDFGADARLLAAFPFPHELDVATSLTATTLTVVTTVRASRASRVPVAFGHRLCFRLPGVARADWRVELPVAEALALDARMLPTGARPAVRVAGGPLGSRTFDDAYVAPEDGAPFVLAGGGRCIEVRFGEGYGYAHVFAPGDDDVIAFEPMTAPIDALVAGGPELPVLAPGESYRAAFSITVTERSG